MIFNHRTCYFLFLYWLYVYTGRGIYGVITGRGQHETYTGGINLYTTNGWLDISVEDYNPNTTINGTLSCVDGAATCNIFNNVSSHQWECVDKKILCARDEFVEPTIAPTKQPSTSLIVSTQSTFASTPNPTTPNHTLDPFIENYANRDIGCNYVNDAGYAMPMDYCMGMVLSGLNLGMKYVCNDSWDGVNMEYYLDDECTGSAILSEPMNSSYDNDLDNIE